MNKPYLFYRPGEGSYSQGEFHSDKYAVGLASTLAFVNQQEIEVYRLELVATVSLIPQPVKVYQETTTLWEDLP